MAAFRHQGQRRFHQLRHGVRHFFHHLRGVDHKHRRHASAGGIPRHRGTRNRRRVYLWTGLAIVVVVVIAVGLLAWNAYRALDRARISAEDARAAVSQIANNPHALLSTTGRAQAVQALQQVSSDAADAQHDLTSSYGLSILGHLPVLDTQRQGVLNLVSDLGITARTGSDLIENVDSLVAASNGTTVALPQLQALQKSVASAYQTLKPMDRPTSGLLSPLASAQREFDTEDAKITTLLQRGNEALSYALPFLGADGTRTYLIAGENNAEMREQGAVLSVAEMTAAGGTLSVDTAKSVGTVALSSPAAVAVPTGTEKIFGNLEPTRLWQSTNATADFPWSGTDMQAMYAQATGQHVDGVIGIDVPALASLLQLTGPVTVPGISEAITASNVASVILNQLYAGFPAGSQVERHDDISAVARAAFDQMRTEHVDLAALANALAQDIAGRHILLWDSDPSYEHTLTDLGASGAIDTTDPTRTFHVAVESATAAKLDYYVHVKVRMDVTITETNEAQVDTYVTVVNDAPAGQAPSYQLGPDGVNSSVPGQYVSRIYLWSPRGSITSSGTPESGLVVNQTAASVLPQKQKTVLFVTVIPHAVQDGKLKLHLVPQPELYPAALTVQVATSPNWTLRKRAEITQTVAKPLTLRWSVTSR